MENTQTTTNTSGQQTEWSEETNQPYDGWSGFPGCGDGQDDLADYMAFENQGW